MAEGESWPWLCALVCSQLSIVVSSFSASHYFLQTNYYFGFVHAIRRGRPCGAVFAQVQVHPAEGGPAAHELSLIKQR
eukprot:scaffold237265_cov21-Prasinocladus_malaysianus.AAC.1